MCLEVWNWGSSPFFFKRFLSRHATVYQHTIFFQICSDIRASDFEGSTGRRGRWTRVTGDKGGKGGGERTPKAAVSHHQPCGLEAGHHLHTDTETHGCRCTYTQSTIEITANEVLSLDFSSIPSFLCRAVLFTCRMFELSVSSWWLHVKKCFRDSFLQKKSKFGFSLSDLLSGSHIDWLWTPTRSPPQTDRHGGIQFRSSKVSLVFSKSISQLPPSSSLPFIYKFPSISCFLPLSPAISRN